MLPGALRCTALESPQESTTTEKKKKGKKGKGKGNDGALSFDSTTYYASELLSILLSSSLHCRQRFLSVKTQSDGDASADIGPGATAGATGGDGGGAAAAAAAAADNDNDTNGDKGDGIDIFLRYISKYRTRNPTRGAEEEVQLVLGISFFGFFFFFFFFFL